LEIALSMATPRLCKNCAAPVKWLETDCPSCGKPTGQRLPWYGWVLGGLLVLLIFLTLSDFNALGQFFTSLAGLHR